MTISPKAEKLPAQGLAASAHGLLDTVREVLVADTDRARTQRAALTAFSVRVASAGILYLSQAILARWMGTFEYGIYISVWVWVLVLGGLSHMGLGVTMIRLLPQYGEAADYGRLRGLLKGGRLAAVASASAIAGLGLLGLWLFGSHISGPYLLPAYLALVCVPLYTLTEVQDGIGRAYQWMAVALLPPYVLRPLLVLAVMGIAEVASFRTDAVTAGAAAIIATWLTALVQTLLLQRRIGAIIPAAKPIHDFGFWLRTALPILVINGCELILQNADVLIIARLMTPADVAVYFAAAKTMSLVMFVHYAVGSAVANKFAALKARGDNVKLQAFIRDAVNWTFWPSLAGAVLILALGKPLLTLFGPQFADGYPVMFVLVLGFLFRAAMGPAEFLLNMLGEQALCAAVLVVTALLNLALNFALIPHFGLMGAAMATSVSLVTAALLYYVVALRRLQIEIAIWNNFRAKG